MSSRRQTATQGNQQTNRNTSEGGGSDKLKNVDGDFLACMRLMESIEDNAKKRKLDRERRRRRTTQMSEKN